MGILVESKAKTDYLIKLRVTQPFWKVVEGIVNMWIKSNPKLWNSYIIHLDTVKADQRRTSIGSSRWRGVSKVTGIERSLVVDFPIWIYLCLKRLYPEENDYLNSKKFFRDMADKFPIFRIREKE